MFKKITTTTKLVIIGAAAVALGIGAFVAVIEVKEAVEKKQLENVKVDPVCEEKGE